MGALQGTAQEEAETPGFRIRGKQTTQKTKTSNTLQAWTQHWQRESSRLVCTHDQVD